MFVQPGIRPFSPKSLLNYFPSFLFTNPRAFKLTPWHLYHQPPVAAPSDPGSSPSHVDEHHRATFLSSPALLSSLVTQHGGAGHCKYPGLSGPASPSLQMIGLPHAKHSLLKPHLELRRQHHLTGPLRRPFPAVPRCMAPPETLHPLSSPVTHLTTRVLSPLRSVLASVGPMAHQFSLPANSSFPLPS